MRCNNCNYSYFNYSENYEDCRLSIPDDECTENRHGEFGCKYNQKTLDKQAKYIEQCEAEEYARMYEFFSREEKEISL